MIKLHFNPRLNLLMCCSLLLCAHTNSVFCFNLFHLIIIRKSLKQPDDIALNRQTQKHRNTGGP